MLAPVELAAIVVLVFLGGGHALGAFDPILGAIGEGWSFLKRQLNSENGASPISVNNRNVSQSETKIEVHNHYYGVDNDERTAISDGGPERDSWEGDRP